MSKNFSELKFPEDISYNSLANICYSTDVIESKSLNELRNINWTQGKMKYDLSYSIKTLSQLKNLIEFFRVHKGRAIGFRFKDWCDFEVKNQHIASYKKDIINYQLFKTYQINGQKEYRPVSKIVENSTKFYNESGKVFAHETSVNGGTFKFLEFPKEGEKIFADFQFDVAVRFDNDQLTYNINSHNVYSCPNLSLIEIKIKG